MKLSSYININLFKRHIPCNYCNCQNIFSPSLPEVEENTYEITSKNKPSLAPNDAVELYSITNMKPHCCTLRSTFNFKLFVLNTYLTLINVSLLSLGVVEHA